MREKLPSFVKCWLPERSQLSSVCTCVSVCAHVCVDERTRGWGGRSTKQKKNKYRLDYTDPKQTGKNLFQETKNRKELRTSRNNRCGRASFHHSCSAVLTLLLPAHPALRSRRRRPNLNPPKDLVRVQVQVRGSWVIEPLLKLLPGCSCFLFHFLFCLFSSDWLLFILV